MKILNLVQGSEEWKAIRLSHFTASEAPIMMGASSHMSRDDLLTYKTTQNEKEVSRFTQFIFDKGHELEALARPIAESILGDDLYPVTGALMVEDLPLLASFDGLTMMEDVAFEHKQWNKEKAEKLERGEFLPEHYWQMEQQLLVSGADNCMFMFSDGTENNMICKAYISNPKRRAQLIAGWKQFQKDLENHQPTVYQEKPEAEAIMDLPALTIQLVGEVKQSNLAVYQKTAMEFIASINTDLQTDQDFANAEKMVKFCDKTEKDLELVKKQALEQTADIALLFRTVDTLKEAMRAKRLELDKLVKSQKDRVRGEIFTKANIALQSVIADANAAIRPIHLPVLPVDFNGAMKGKKTIKSLHEAVNDELARVKIDVSETTNHILKNMNCYEKLASNHVFLFNDLQQLIMKDGDDFALLVESRINKHEEVEAQRLELERQRIQAQEEAKAKAEIEAEAEAAKQAEDRAIAEQAHQAIADQNNELPEPVQAKRSQSYSNVNAAINDVMSKPVEQEAINPIKNSEQFDDIVSYLMCEVEIDDFYAAERIANDLILGRVPHVSLNQTKQTKAA